MVLSPATSPLKKTNVYVLKLNVMNRVANKILVMWSQVWLHVAAAQWGDDGLSSKLHIIFKPCSVITLYWVLLHHRCVCTLYLMEYLFLCSWILWSTSTSTSTCTLMWRRLTSCWVTAIPTRSVGVPACWLKLWQFTKCRCDLCIGRRRSLFWLEHTRTASLDSIRLLWRGEVKPECSDGGD